MMIMLSLVDYVCHCLSAWLFNCCMIVVDDVVCCVISVDCWLLLS